MNRQEEQYSSLRIERSVIETQVLRRFMAAADFTGRVIFAAEELAVVPSVDLTSDEELYDVGSLHNVGVARHRIYDSEKLKLPLLDKRSPQDMYRPLLRAYERLRVSPDTIPRPKNRSQNTSTRKDYDWRRELCQAALSHDIPDSNTLEVEFDHLSFETNPGYEHRGLEVSLEPSILSSETILLHEEAAICFKALVEINRKLAYPTSKTSPQVAFVRLPKDATDEQVIEYCELVKQRLPINVTLGEPHPSLS